MDIILLLIGAVLPAVILLFFINWQDQYKKEPMGWLWKGFGYGAAVAAIILFVSIILEIVGISTDTEEMTLGGAIRFSLFEAAIPEELLKFLFLWLLLRKNPYYDEYFDGIVYAVCVGLGFAALENIAYLIEYYDNWVTIGIMRGLISVPGHFMFAVVMGYFYAKASFGDPAQRKKNLALAICVPILIHALFDTILFGSTVLWWLYLLCLPFFAYLFVKSKRLGKEHLALDKQIMGSEQAAPPAEIPDTAPQEDDRDETSA